MINSRNLYVLPVIENGQALSYYCLVSLMIGGCTWVLLRDEELLSHGVCNTDDVGLMLDSLRIDLSLSGGSQEWATKTIH